MCSSPLLPPPQVTGLGAGPDQVRVDVVAVNHPALHAQRSLPRPDWSARPARTTSSTTRSRTSTAAARGGAPATRPLEHAGAEVVSTVRPVGDIPDVRVRPRRHTGPLSRS